MIESYEVRSSLEPYSEAGVYVLDSKLVLLPRKQQSFKSIGDGDSAVRIGQMLRQVAVLSYYVRFGLWLLAGLTIGTLVWEYIWVLLFIPFALLVEYLWCRSFQFTICPLPRVPFNFTRRLEKLQSRSRFLHVLLMAVAPALIYSAYDKVAPLTALLLAQAVWVATYIGLGLIFRVAVNKDLRSI